MTALLVILGILLVAGGFSCMFTPLLTFMNIGYFVVILMVVFGVVGIIKAIAEKRFGINFVFSILSIILGVVMVLFPGSLLFAEGTMLILTAIWFIVMGIVSIVNAITLTKATGSSIWILQLIFGILAIFVGGYSFFHPMFMAVSLGILIGIFFIETGFTLMFSGFAIND
ncbi:MAG: HdeD family acid-resistance protein [bacterium]